jgi:hypothetical protein
MTEPAEITSNEPSENTHPDRPPEGPAFRQDDGQSITVAHAYEPSEDPALRQVDGQGFTVARADSLPKVEQFKPKSAGRSRSPRRKAGPCRVANDGPGGNRPKRPGQSKPGRGIVD